MSNPNPGIVLPVVGGGLFMVSGTILSIALLLIKDLRLRAGVKLDVVVAATLLSSVGLMISGIIVDQ